MQRRRSWFCGLGRGAVAVLVFAGALASPGAFATEAKLDAEGVVRLALLRNHDLQAARAQVKAALGHLRQAGMWPNPKLELSNDTDRPFANEGEYSRAARFSQELAA